MNDFPIGYCAFIAKDAEPPAGWQEIPCPEGAEPAMGWDAEGNSVECKLIEKVN